MWTRESRSLNRRMIKSRFSRTDPCRQNLWSTSSSISRTFRKTRAISVGRAQPSGAKLWLIRPLGFQLDEKHLRRAGMDYWKIVDWEAVDSWAEVRERLPGRNWWALTKTATRLVWDAQFSRRRYPPVRKRNTRVACLDSVRTAQSEFAFADEIRSAQPQSGQYGQYGSLRSRATIRRIAVILRAVLPILAWRVRLCSQSTTTGRGSGERRLDGGQEERKRAKKAWTEEAAKPQQNSAPQRLIWFKPGFGPRRCACDWLAVAKFALWPLSTKAAKSADP